MISIAFSWANTHTHTQPSLCWTVCLPLITISEGGLKDVCCSCVAHRWGCKRKRQPLQMKPSLCMIMEISILLFFHALLENNCKTDSNAIKVYKRILNGCLMDYSKIVFSPAGSLTLSLGAPAQTGMATLSVTFSLSLHGHGFCFGLNGPLSVDSLLLFQRGPRTRLMESLCEEKGWVNIQYHSILVGFLRSDFRISLAAVFHWLFTIWRCWLSDSVGFGAHGCHFNNLSHLHNLRIV